MHLPNGNIHGSARNLESGVPNVGSQSTNSQRSKLNKSRHTVADSDQEKSRKKRSIQYNHDDKLSRARSRLHLKMGNPTNGRNVLQSNLIANCQRFRRSDQRLIGAGQIRLRRSNANEFVAMGLNSLVRTLRGGRLNGEPVCPGRTLIQRLVRASEKPDGGHTMPLRA